MNPDDLARVAQLLELAASTVRLFSDTDEGNGRMSRVTELSQQIDAIAAELIAIAERRKADQQK